MTRPRILVLTRHDAPLAVARGTRETVESLPPPPGWPLLAVLLISFALWMLIAAGIIAFWEVLR